MNLLKRKLTVTVVTKQNVPSPHGHGVTVKRPSDLNIETVIVKLLEAMHVTFLSQRRKQSDKF